MDRGTTLTAHTAKPAVFRPGARQWVLYGFVTLLIAFQSLFFFFDPVGPLVRLLGGAGIALWIGFLIASARARLEIHDDTVEVYSPAYRLAPSKGGKVVFAVLVVFVAYDLAVLALGTPPLWMRQLRFVGSFALVALYLILMLLYLEPGRRNIRYTDIVSAPEEVDWQPSPWVRKKALFMEVSRGTTPFQFPPWLSEDDRHEVQGRVTARMKHAHALEQAREAALDGRSLEAVSPES